MKKAACTEAALNSSSLNSSGPKQTLACTNPLPRQASLLPWPGVMQRAGRCSRFPEQLRQEQFVPGSFYCRE